MTMPHHGKHVSGGRYVLILLALFTMGNVADWWVESFAPVTMAFQKHSTSTTGNNPTNKLHLEVTKSSTADQDTATNSRRREIKIKTTSHHHDKENKETSPPPSLLIDANSIIAQTGGRNFPHSMIVDQELIKKALLLAAVNERVGGVVIWGGRGTEGKSVMARAMRDILPPIKVIKNNPFNIDPKGEFGVDDYTVQDIKDGGVPLEEREVGVIPCPFVQVPVNVMEDRLIGSVDIEKSIKEGRTVFSPGILAGAHRGVLFVDDINLLEDDVINILLNAVKEGYVSVEREGISLRYPCRPLLIATYNPEEGELKEHFLDRIGVSLCANAFRLKDEERVQAVDNVMFFTDSAGTKRAEEGKSAIAAAMEKEYDTQASIMFAKELLADVDVSKDQIQYLCEEAIRAGVQGHRADIFALQVAKANAALDGRAQVNARDLTLAVQLAIAPRGTWVEELDGNEESKPMPASASQPAQIPPSPEDHGPTHEDQDEPSDEKDEEQEDSEDDINRHDTELVPDIPEELQFAPDATPIDPKLLHFLSIQRRGKGKGRRNRIFSQDRGRYVKAIFPHGKGGHIAVAATLRAAAPYQLARRKRFQHTKYENRRVHIDSSDIRIKKMARKAGSLVIFVVDASGSMAMNRMQAAKGSAISLLAEAYKCRDQIALIGFREDTAEVLLPPTKSIAMARRRLEGLPCGGGSPLAHALQLAMRTGINAVKKSSGTLGKVVVVLITDGRANIALSESLGEEFNPENDENCTDGHPSREYLKEEVLALAKIMGSLPDFNLLCIDTEKKFLSTGLAKEIAACARGKYYPLPKGVDRQSVATITSEAMQQ